MVNAASCDFRTMGLMIHCLPYMGGVFHLTDRQWRTVLPIVFQVRQYHAVWTCWQVWESPGNIYPGSDLDTYGDFFSNTQWSEWWPVLRICSQLQWTAEWWLSHGEGVWYELCGNCSENVLKNCIVSYSCFDETTLVHHIRAQQTKFQPSPVAASLNNENQSCCAV